MKGTRVNSRGHAGVFEEGTWKHGQQTEQGRHEYYVVDLVRNRKGTHVGRRIGRGLSYEAWLARCCDLMLYLTGRRWKHGYDWHRAYHRRKLTVAEAVDEAIERGDLEYDEDVPIRDYPDTLEELLEGI